MYETSDFESNSGWWEAEAWPFRPLMLQVPVLFQPKSHRAIATQPGGLLPKKRTTHKVAEPQGTVPAYPLFTQFMCIYCVSLCICIQSTLYPQYRSQNSANVVTWSLHIIARLVLLNKASGGDDGGYTYGPVEVIVYTNLYIVILLYIIQCYMWS